MQTNESSYNEEYLSGSIDGTLTPDEQAHLSAVSAAMPHIQAELEELRALKTMLRTRREQVVELTPADVRTSVLKALRHEYQQEAIRTQESTLSQTEAVLAITDTQATPERSAQSALPKHAKSVPHTPSLFDLIFGWLPQPRFAYATIIMLAITGVGNMVWNVAMRDTTARSASAEKQMSLQNALQFASFADQSLSNHSAVVAGKITLQKATSSFNELQQFFREKGIEYPVVQPKVQATLLGGVVSEHDGVKLAHLVFQCADKSLLYMWQVPENMMSPAHIYLAYSTMNSLDKGEWMWQSQAKETLAIWEVHEKSKAIVCAMVSDMPQQKMMALFQ